ncbi:MAG: ATP-binding cassette domain-containing protein [Cellulosilyticaceae bacterium]
MREVILQTRDLTKIYGSHTAVDKVNLNVAKGEIYGLVGKNGAGKTTIMKMLTGLIETQGGEIELFGKSYIDDLNKARVRTGMIIETPAFYPYLSAKKNLEYYRIQRGIADKACVDHVLQQVGLGDVGNKKFKQFSLGMKQRLGLALAIMGSPDLLILDEPTNGLDPEGIVEVRETLLRLNRERGVTILISSHILDELSKFATCYGFMKEGKLVEEITAKAIEEKCRHHLLVRVDDPAKASVILEEQLGCTGYEIHEGNEIKVYEHMDAPEKVTQMLVTGGVMVSGIQVIGSSLEQYFMALVGGEHCA